MGKISDLPALERPREKAIRYGIEKLSDHELIALLIGSGSINSSAIDIAYKMLSDNNGLFHLVKKPFRDLLNYKGMIEEIPWPKVNEAALSNQPVTYAIQVNGKVRDTIDFEKDASEDKIEELKQLALASEKVKNFTEGKTIVKVIVVKNKIVSIVVK